MPFDRTTIQRAAAILAEAGVYVGTSSWKYDGWFDQLYTPARYEYRGKVAKTRFERECLAIGVGCTGGRHRSAVVAEELGMFFMKKGMPVTVEHRDLHRE